MTNLLTGILATWRISHMLINEGAPYDLLARFRHFAGVRYDAQSRAYGTNEFARGLICPFCNSVWFGWIVALLLRKRGVGAFVAGLAYSAGSIIVERIVSK